MGMLCGGRGACVDALRARGPQALSSSLRGVKVSALRSHKILRADRSRKAEMRLRGSVHESGSRRLAGAQVLLEPFGGR